MSDVTQKPDAFQTPKTFVSPSVQNIFKDDTFLEECIAYSYYRPLPPVERIIPGKPTRHVQFHFRDLNAFFNPKNCYILMKFFCEKADGTPLQKTDFTSALNPISHCAIETYSLNIGECEIFRVNRLYFLMAKLYFLNNCSEQSRNTFRAFFEGYVPDINSSPVDDVSTCFETNDDGTPSDAKNPQGKVAELLLDKKELFFLFQLHSPLESFQSLILNAIDLGD